MGGTPSVTSGHRDTPFSIQSWDRPRREHASNRNLRCECRLCLPTALQETTLPHDAFWPPHMQQESGPHSDITRRPCCLAFPPPPKRPPQSGHAHVLAAEHRRRDAMQAEGERDASRDERAEKEDATRHDLAASAPHVAHQGARFASTRPYYVDDAETMPASTPTNIACGAVVGQEECVCRGV